MCLQLSVLKVRRNSYDKRGTPGAGNQEKLRVLSRLKPSEVMQESGAHSTRRTVSREASHPRRGSMVMLWGCMGSKRKTKRDRWSLRPPPHTGRS